MTAIGPSLAAMPSLPISCSKIKADTMTVAIVTPEIGLFELPTRPAI